MKLYKNGEWSQANYESLNVTIRDCELFNFWDYMEQNNFKRKAIYHQGDDFGWDVSIYRHKEREFYIATASFKDENWVEFFISDPFSFMTFCKEYESFFKDRVDEWVETADGRWLKRSSIKWVGQQEVSRGKERDEYRFFCGTDDGEEFELQTVVARGYYMRRNFGIDHYQDHTRNDE